MKNKRSDKSTVSTSQSEDLARRKRERLLIVIIAAVVALITYAEFQVIHFGAEFPVSNTILMFILININLLLLILLIFLVFRNLVKLLYDRKRKVMGARLRTRLVVAFIALTLLPTIVLFFFAINFITTSIEFWFNVPVEHALENSLSVGRSIYDRAESNNRFYLEKVAYQINKKDLFNPKNIDALSRYLRVVQREFYIDAVEVYDNKASRLTFSVSDDLENKMFDVVASDKLLGNVVVDDVWSVSEFVSTGELIRTIGTVPYGKDSDEAKGFLILSILIPPDLAQNMKSISRGFEEYRLFQQVDLPVFFKSS